MKKFTTIVSAIVSTAIIVAILTATIIKTHAVDIQSFTITEGNNKALVLPRQIITAKVTQSFPPYTVLADFTGANAIEFPEVMSTLTPEQRNELTRMIAIWLVKTKAGIVEEQ